MFEKRFCEMLSKQAVFWIFKWFCASLCTHLFSHKVAVFCLFTCLRASGSVGQVVDFVGDDPVVQFAKGPEVCEFRVAPN